MRLNVKNLVLVAWGGIERFATEPANPHSHNCQFSRGTRWGTPNRPAENRKLRLRTTDISAAALDYPAFATARQARIRSAIDGSRHGGICDIAVLARPYFNVRKQTSLIVAFTAATTVCRKPHLRSVIVS
jgi:hypothetical protein